MWLLHMTSKNLRDAFEKGFHKHSRSLRRGCWRLLSFPHRIHEPSIWILCSEKLLAPRVTGAKKTIASKEQGITLTVHVAPPRNAPGIDARVGMH
jgi:hypothetical protein